MKNKQQLPSVSFNTIVNHKHHINVHFQDSIDLSLNATSIAELDLQCNSTEVIIHVARDTISRLIRVSSDSHISSVKSLVASKLLISDSNADRLSLYLLSTGIYLKQGNRPLWTYYICNTDTLTLKKPELPIRTISVYIEDLDQQEYVPVWRDTTTMGLIQLLVNKDVALVTNYFLSCDGKTPLGMNDILPKVSYFTYCAYPQPSPKDLGSNREDQLPLHLKTEVLLPMTSSCCRISRSFSSDNNRELNCIKRKNTENQPSILIEKNWRTTAQENRFVPLNRIFLPPLESLLHTNFPPQVILADGSNFTRKYVKERLKQ
jgi:hypothetical protein